MKNWVINKFYVQFKRSILNFKTAVVKSIFWIGLLGTPNPAPLYKWKGLHLIKKWKVRLEIFEFRVCAVGVILNFKVSETNFTKFKNLEPMWEGWHCPVCPCLIAVFCQGKWYGDKREKLEDKRDIIINGFRTSYRDVPT